MNDPKREALELNIVHLTREIHAREKSTAPIKAKIAELETQRQMQRNQNETLVTENASLTRENEQLEKHLASVETIVETLKAETARVRRNAFEVLNELVLVPSERHKREQMIANADSFFTVRMWVGVWEAERDGTLKKTASHHTEPLSDAQRVITEVAMYRPISPFQY